MSPSQYNVHRASILWVPSEARCAEWSENSLEERRGENPSSVVVSSGKPAPMAERTVLRQRFTSKQIRLLQTRIDIQVFYASFFVY